MAQVLENDHEERCSRSERKAGMGEEVLAQDNAQVPERAREYSRGRYVLFRNVLFLSSLVHKAFYQKSWSWERKYLDYQVSGRDSSPKDREHFGKAIPKLFFTFIRI